MGEKDNIFQMLTKNCIHTHKMSIEHLDVQHSS